MALRSVRPQFWEKTVNDVLLPVQPLGLHCTDRHRVSEKTDILVLKLTESEPIHSVSGKGSGFDQ